MPIGSGPTNKPFPSSEHWIGQPAHGSGRRPIRPTPTRPRLVRHRNRHHRQSRQRRRGNPFRRGQHHPHLNVGNRHRQHSGHARPNLNPLGPLPTVRSSPIATPHVDSQLGASRHVAPHRRREPVRRHCQPTWVHREPGPQLGASTGRPVVARAQPDTAIRHHVGAAGARRGEVNLPRGRRRSRRGSQRRAHENNTDQQVHSHGQAAKTPPGGLATGTITDRVIVSAALSGCPPGPLPSAVARPPRRPCAS